MNWRIASVALLIGCTLPCLRATMAADAGARRAKPCVVITGANSRVAEPRYRRIASEEEWATMWQEHKGRKPTKPYDFFYDPLALPRIAFDAYMVVAIFEGTGWNSAGLEAVSISEEASRVVFRFKRKSYSTIRSYESDLGPELPLDELERRVLSEVERAGDQGDKVNVYGFFVLPRSTKTLVLEVDARHEKRGPPAWKERAVFPTLVGAERKGGHE
jgi:hypothetical protein